MTIKHLVISGGGPNGILAYGVASQLAKKGFWKLSDIKSMYGCSIGAYMSVLFSLGYAWDWLDDYLIKRPWDKLVAASTTRLIDIYEKKCLLNEHFFIEAITPLLRARDLNEATTLADLYAYNHIEIHMYTTNINGLHLDKIDLSYKTHPTLSVITALRMSMAFPIIFEPIFMEECCYIDGGLINNFPLNDCIDQQKCDMDEILAFKNMWQSAETAITEKSSVFDFLAALLKKMQAAIDTESEQINIKYIVPCLSKEVANFKKWAETLNSEAMRRTIIDDGHAQADAFLLDHSQPHQDNTDTNATHLFGAESTINKLD
jgi:predicted acylesterase/phospholipase RssA